MPAPEYMTFGHAISILFHEKQQNVTVTFAERHWTLREATSISKKGLCETHKSTLPPCFYLFIYLFSPLNFLLVSP